MKKITLKPVTVPLPRDASISVRMAVAKAEESMRENNRIVEQAINDLIIDNVTVNQDASGYLHIS